MPLLSLRAYAKHRGVHLQAVQKAIRDGRIQTRNGKDGKPKIDRDQADADWGASTDPSKQRGEHAEAARGSGGANAAAQAYATARAMRETYAAKAAELKYRKMAGELVEVQEIRSEIFESSRKVRDAILNVPNRVATELAAETDPQKIFVRLTEELNLALRELADAVEAEEVADAGESDGDS